MDQKTKRMSSEASVRLREEDEELQRSTKKVKETHRGDVIIEDASPHAEGTGSSYKAKLTGEIPGAYEKAFRFEDDLDMTNDSDDESPDLEAGIASLNLSGAKKASIRALWSNALIVKVIGKTVGYHFLTLRIMSIWKPCGRLECIDLEQDFFLIHFSSKEDFDRVLKEGPWFVGGHFLSIRKWEPNFKPSTASVSSVAVWVRFPKLPIEYYEPTVLRDLGQIIGPVLRIDTRTASESRGRYARICVQVNFANPLIKIIKIGGVKQPVQYEGINLLCFSCGRVGHKMESCHYTVKATEKVGEDGINSADTPVVDRFSPSEETFGPWVLVTRKKTS